MTRLGAWPTRAEEGRRRRGGSEASRAGAQGTRATGVDRQWQVARRSGVGASPASHPHPHHHHLHTPAARSLARSLEPIRFSVRPTKKISGGARRGPNLPLPAAVAVRSVAAIRARAVACRCPGQPPIHAAPVLGPTPQYRRRTPPASAAQRAPPSSTSPPPSLRRDATRIHPSPSKSLDRARLFHTAAGRGMMSESDRSAPSEARRRETG
jgi:hypothetical protein